MSVARQGVDSPVGRLWIEARSGQVSGIGWGDCDAAPDDVTEEAAAQLAGYFARERQAFDLPLALPADGFQRRFLEALLAVPFGHTVTYGELGQVLETPAQAIGQACGGNPLPIVIPCHRVLATGSLGGYSGAGGIETKVALLRHEGAGGLLI